MKSILAHTLLLVGAVSLPAAVPEGKTQQLTSPDQVPEGLVKSDWSSIRAAYEAGLHAFQPVPGKDGIWQARNPGQQWLTTFDQHGFVAQPQGGGWSWGLELKSYGFGEKQAPISGQPEVKAAGQRLSYQWDAAVQEWWVNDPRGLEHGFTIGQRPDGISDRQSQISDPLAITLGVRGSLRPTLTADAKGLLFQDATGATVLNYTGLKVWDADGQALPSRFEMTDSQPSTPNSQPTVRLLVDERNARYPITIDPIAQQAYLKASNTGLGDHFGCSVAISGDTVVVGAYGESSDGTGVGGNQADNSAYYSGAAYVFTRSGGVWIQQAYLKASNTGENDYFGCSVAVSGDTVVVGAWWEDSNATGVNAAVLGGTGTQADNSVRNSGAAYVFARSAGVWSQQAYLKASNTGMDDHFGLAVAVSENTVIVGADAEESNATGVGGNQADNSAIGSGSAYVFTRSGGEWSQQAYLKASNTGAGDSFGSSVAVSGDTVVVGANLEDSNAIGVNREQANNSTKDSGAAYVFTRSDGLWSQQAYLKASNTGQIDLFGVSVALADDTLVVGALLEHSNATGVDADVSGGSGTQADNSATYSGAAYVFTRSGGEWSQQAYLKASNTGAGDYFGCSVAVSGDTVVVGAFGEGSKATGVNGTQADNSASESGAAYVFTRSGGTWSQQAYLKASNTGLGDHFGDVAISGDTVVVGAWQESSNATGVNAATGGGSGTQADNSIYAPGAVYTYTITLPLLDPVILTQPADQQVVLGGIANFSIMAAGTGTLRYQWRFNSKNILGATATTLNLTKLQASQQGSYECVVTGPHDSVTSAPAELTVLQPVTITRQPVGGHYRVAGEKVILSVQASGVAPFEYQWRKNGVPMVGVANDTMKWSPSTGSAGDYDVIVSNAFSSATSAVARMVVVDPPIIMQQPTGMDVQPGGTAEFSTAVTGHGLTYQWRRNGVNISVGKAAIYSIANAQKATHEGWYDCVVKSIYGSVITERAYLGVGDSLRVSVAPGDQSVATGDSVTFTADVQTSDTGIITYQWSRNDAAITGAKSQNLTLANVDLSKAGAYSVLVTRGTLKASASTLLVVADPGLLIYKLTGTRSSFKGVATTTSAFAGTLLVNRWLTLPQAVMILTSKDGSYNVFKVQAWSNLFVSTTGPEPKAQTIFSEFATNRFGSHFFLWLQGAESLVTLTPTMKTLAPQTMKGSTNSLFFNPNGGPTRTETETVSLSAVLDAPNTTISRQKAETLEEAIERLSLDLLLKGYADQTQAP